MTNTPNPDEFPFLVETTHLETNQTIRSYLNNIELVKNHIQGINQDEYVATVLHRTNHELVASSHEGVD